MPDQLTTPLQVAAFCAPPTLMRCSNAMDTWIDAIEVTRVKVSAALREARSSGDVEAVELLTSLDATGAEVLTHASGRGQARRLETNDAQPFMVALRELGERRPDLKAKVVPGRYTGP